MEGCIWYLDDIVISGANTESEQQAIVEKVLQQCVKHGLAVNLLQSDFHIKETTVLRHVIKGQEVKIHPSKLESVSKWPIPTKKKQVKV